jgi:hypothetical protein
MGTINRIPANLATTPLERHVRNWLNREAKNYDSGVSGVTKDLQQGGCQSGFVGHLIYYRDTVRFYKRHQREIDVMLRDLLDDCGGGPADLFKRAAWDDSDPLAREDGNQNILAWFGFEETARKLYELAEQKADEQLPESVCDDGSIAV